MEQVDDQMVDMMVDNQVEELDIHYFQMVQDLEAVMVCYVMMMDQMDFGLDLEQD